ncbi:hypothetical protein RE9431_49470 (plasmid) [Prescottella equi]|uniref:Uncharacterized protein n=1 Tax=Rhodococcus hoagii TaxID=43767 RepID=A0A1Z1UWN4_RHOHA|nr:N-formylglutamate amidohydrolase [Prescottella equi]ARX59887.1 hypothetical protein pVAPN1354_1400 [Prescottella equi]WQB74486.1 N-formylglutamate amidohydrolase [Prescottella equi]BCN46690.1 hypothetical protein RE9414_49700 [Prescottella equi]BCN66492.1 hypothetical protein RE9431_49470 [Prescottella equi]BCN71393.1 hypothetical protein RE943_48660 [Prescottella equi]
MVIDRAVLAARIRQAHLAALPSFTAGPLDESTTIVVAQALATEDATLTVTVSSSRFDVGPRGWDLAAAGTAVTVTVTCTDTESGARRHVQLREPEAWARAVIAEVDDGTTRVYLLGGIDPETGQPERGLVAYRFFLAEDATPIRVPPQLLTTPHYWIGPLD